MTLRSMEQNHTAPHLQGWKIQTGHHQQELGVIGMKHMFLNV